MLLGSRKTAGFANALYQRVGQQRFSTMGIPALAARTFTVSLGWLIMRIAGVAMCRRRNASISSSPVIFGMRGR